ncbi:MAG: succinylglutamate desuccinylase/aspartoacylase family protein [Desulfobacterales bacterium]
MSTMNIQESAVRILEYFRRHAAGSTPFCMQISSRNPGAHVVIVGGTHGNEPGGVKAIVQLHRAFRNGEITLKQGKISFLLGNPKAFEKDVRHIDSDLNRVFVKQAPSSVEGKRALEIDAFLGDHDDINALLDLHSVSIGNFKLLVYPNDDSGSTEFALRLSSIALHFGFHPMHMPGTLIAAAGARGIRGLIVECGNHYAKQAVETARQHIHNFLVLHDLIDEGYMSQETTPARVTFYESIQAIKPHADFVFLIKDIRTGTRLSKGQKYAKDTRGYHVAPQDCHVVVPSRVVKPTDDDAGFLGKLTVLDGSELKHL